MRMRLSAKLRGGSIMINLVVMVVVAVVVALETVLAMRELKFVKENEQCTGTEKAINYQNKDIPTIIMVCYTLPFWVVISAIYQIIAGILVGIGYTIKNKFLAQIKRGIVPHYDFIITEEIFDIVYRIITAKIRKREEKEIKEKEIKKQFNTVVKYAKAYLNKQCNRKALINEYKSLKELTNEYSFKEIFACAKQDKKDTNIGVFMKELAIKKEFTKEEIKQKRFYIKLNRTFLYV